MTRHPRRQRHARAGVPELGQHQQRLRHLSRRRSPVVCRRQPQLRYFLAADNSLWGWGNNMNGEIGGYSTAATLPLPDHTVSGPKRNNGSLPYVQWASVDGGVDHTLGVAIDGTVWAWGAAGFNQLGFGVNASSFYPQQLYALGSTGVWVNAGRFVSAAGDTAGARWMWGINQYGQAGQDKATSPVGVTKLP